LKKPESKKKLSAAALSPAAASKAPFLTTRNGLIVDQTGKEVVMKGINWFGWNTNLDATGERLYAFFWPPSCFFRLSPREKREREAPLISFIASLLVSLSSLFSGNFTNGADAVAQDAGWATTRAAMMVKGMRLFLLVSREREREEQRRSRTRREKNSKKPRARRNKKSQGFNAVRLPFRFRDVAPGRVPYNYTRLCGVPSQDDAKASSVVPPAASRPTLLPAATRSVSTKGGGDGVKVPLRLPSLDFPDIPPFPNSTKGVCNAAMPQLDSRERFLWNVWLLIERVRSSKF